MCGTCQDVLEGLERIDGETDELDINFVKINDPKYAKKYGVSKLPALVYFRKKFPSIYRGENRVFKKVSTLLLKIFSTALLFIYFFCRQLVERDRSFNVAPDKSLQAYRAELDHVHGALSSPGLPILFGLYHLRTAT